MAVEFRQLIKAGEATLQLGVEDPTINGVVADISTIATATDQKQWVKIGPADTDWRIFLTSEDDGTFTGSFKLPDISDIVAGANVLGVSSEGKLCIGDGTTLGGVGVGGGDTYIDEAVSTSDVVSDVDIGGIHKLDVIQSGTTLQAFIENILTKTYYPTFTNPSAFITDNLPNKVEVGTIGTILNANLNRGSINGDIVNGIWLQSTAQDFRSGPPIQYTFSGSYIDTESQSDSSLVLSTEVIEEGVNNFGIVIDYAEGPQPKDSDGNNFQTPLPAGSVSTSLTVNGKRNAFYGSSSEEFAPNSSSEIRTLNSKLDPVNNTTFTITAPAGEKHIVFAYPSSLREVSEVIHNESNFDVKDTFEEQSIIVSGANGYVGIEYRVYIFTPIAPLASTNTYTVTI